MTKKKCYFNKRDVQDALIYSQVHFRVPAVSYYRCDQCSNFHLTSKGPVNDFLKQPEVTALIRKQKKYLDF